MNLQDLNTPQYRAVTTTEGSVLVIAGAGSGKTRTLVYRVASLVDQGVAPERILLLSFTRKASQEMISRAGRLLGSECNRVTGGTFHSIANMLLRRFAGSLNFDSSFSIIDRADAEGIINLLRSSLGLNAKDKRFPTKRLIINLFSSSINRSIPLQVLIENEYDHLLEHYDALAELAEHYKNFKFEHSLMDYDDLLVNWNRLLDNETACERITGRFDYILVDEYQDTNPIQAEIVRKMAQTHGNVMAVGDDSQSIYSFRGADFYNIMRFPEIFPQTEVITLEENYRSTQPILSFTNSIIHHATEKYEKKLYSSIEGTIKPKVFAGRDEHDEAEKIISIIDELQVEHDILPHNIAILFRSGFHSYKLELALTSQKIEYEKRGGLKLTESAHIKDFLSFLRVLVNTIDTLSWNRILLQLEGIGPATAQKISTSVANSDDWLAELHKYPAGKRWKKTYQELVILFEKLVEEKETPPEFLYEIIFSYYYPIFKRLYHDDYPKRQKDLEQLRGLLEDYEDIQQFIDDTTLDPPEEGGSDKNSERLILSTIHSAKGLEFDAVCIIGLAEGRFPHPAAYGTGLEEERRLFYVATTRARKFLYLSYPRRIMSVDHFYEQTGMSLFLTEVDSVLYDRVDNLSTKLPKKKVKKDAEKLLQRYKKKERMTIEQFSIGTRIRHFSLGKGVVKKICNNTSLEILFDRYGTKTINLNYVTLEIV